MVPGIPRPAGSSDGTVRSAPAPRRLLPRCSILLAFCCSIGTMDIRAHATFSFN